MREKECVCVRVCVCVCVYETQRVMGVDAGSDAARRSLVGVCECVYVYKRKREKVCEREREIDLE